MDKDTLYFHLANLGLVIIGILSIQKIVSPIVASLMVLGSLAGFFFSWYIKDSRPPHIDTFIGMLSLASVVVILSRLYDIEISFENLLKVFSTTLAWLSLFQSFGLKAQKSYSLIQFISAALLISSVSLALEQEIVYVLYLAAFLFILIFAMRLDLVCEKKNRGSMIIGDKEEAMSLWHQIRLGAIMFSIILTLSALIYPVVPRFNSLSLDWIPSTLIGLPEKVPLLKLMKSADKSIKDAKVKKEQRVDDGAKKRETAENKFERKSDEEREERPQENKEEKTKEEKIERFKASEFNKNIDAFKIESLTIRSDKKELPLDSEALLTAEVKLTDGSSFNATKLVDWKVTGNSEVFIDKNGLLTPKSEGYIQISATYMGTFSNDVNIKITQAVSPKKKKSFFFYFIISLLWILALGLAVFSARIFIRSQKLAEMFKDNPREFIKEIYIALCKLFKIYGIQKFDHISYREFYCLAKEFISERSEPMRIFTECFLEARFSTHEISAEHSQKAVELFREVKGIILEKEERNKFWKGFLLRLNALDVLMLPK